MNPTVTELRRRLRQLARYYPSYEPVLVQVLFALLTRNHVLWVSPPGQSKSTVSRYVFGLFAATVFEYQLNRETMLDDVVGPINLEVYRETARQERSFDGGIVKSQFAFLDELFDANDFLLRALLGILYERRYSSISQPHEPAELHSVIATTNFDRSNAATEAVRDRFLCKAYMPDIELDPVDVLAASETYLYGVSLPSDHIAYEALDQVCTDVKKVTVSPGLRLLHDQLIRQYLQRVKARTEAEAKAKSRTEQPAVSTAPPLTRVSRRTRLALLDFSRAAALLDGRTTVEIGDLRSLCYGLITIGANPDDEALWHKTCDELLDMSDRQLASLETSAARAAELSVVKEQLHQLSSTKFWFNGHYVPLAELAFDERAIKEQHLVLDLVMTELRTMISQFKADRDDRVTFRL